MRKTTIETDLADFTLQGLFLQEPCLSITLSMIYKFRDMRVLEVFNRWIESPWQRNLSWLLPKKRILEKNEEY